MSSPIRTEIIRYASALREREGGLSVDDADLVDDLERWMLASVIPDDGAPRRRDYRSDGTGPIPKGRRLPSVTGIMGVLGFSKEAIARWAAREAAQACAEFMIEGAAVGDAIQRARFAPFSKRDELAEGGTLAHGMVEAYLKGIEVEDDPFLPDATTKAARDVLNRFRAWFDRGEYDVVHVEHPVVDQQLGYGGTIDIVLRRRADNTLIVVDLKTGKSIYDEQIIQLGGYSCLLNNVEGLQVREGLIVHVPLVPLEVERHIEPIKPETLALGASHFAVLFWIHRTRKQLTIGGK